ncbi:hypothetical protein SS50377_27413 [Spironucleus salmonicida]|uniref:Uncharacterized protein n=1 Tax=Spironucleus salmonicida TaxID=348837 RepID=V6LFM6_9EUKA|nr:hypothetical protein SS50377_27413 [Spironucleus salmonicida]|eukprot:EST43297.1 Hypothetical protein SS50377_16964 [Spironucleus salmonicida]
MDDVIQNSSYEQLYEYRNRLQFTLGMAESYMMQKIEAGSVGYLLHQGRQNALNRHPQAVWLNVQKQLEAEGAQIISEQECVLRQIRSSRAFTPKELEKHPVASVLMDINSYYQDMK